MSAEWVPEFEGQRPPFEPGNRMAVKHGAQSPRMVEPVARALVDSLLADGGVAYLRAARFASAVEAWAVAEAKCRLIAAWVDRMPIERAAESVQGQTSPLELLRRWEATAATHRARLGLDPLSAARLGKDIASGKGAEDAALLLTRMREEYDRQRAAGSAPAGEESTDE